MNKLIILAILFSVVVMTGCATKDSLVCNKPYIQMGTTCCLDTDDNSICDTDDKPAAKEPVAKESPVVSCPLSQKMIDSECCTDSDNNSVCDSKEKPVDKTPVATKKTPTELMNSVVIINATGYDYFLDDSGETIRPPVEYQGSGFVVDKDGYVITNFHLASPFMVCSEYEISAKLCSLKATIYNDDNRRTYDMDWVGFSYEWDIAILKINNTDERNFDYLNISPTSGKIGDTIYVIGAPMGYDYTITKGIISQKDRPSYINDSDKYKKYLQTDAAINFGNSGGPMVNEAGDVVAMSTYGYDKSYTEGLNFGLQSEMIQDLYNKAYKNISFFRNFYKDGLDSDSRRDNVRMYDSINIRNLEPAKFFTRENTGEVSFESIKFNAKNEENRSIKLCFDLTLVSTSGIIGYNDSLSYTFDLAPEELKTISLKPDIKFRSDYIHFYQLNINDCDTKERYAKIYGVSTW